MRDLMRAKKKENNGASAIPITVRQLEAVVRISEVNILTPYCLINLLNLCVSVSRVSRVSWVSRNTHGAV
jgi:hypothetical protein